MSEMTKLEKLELQERQAHERVVRERQRLASVNRKARNHALMTMGGLLEARLGGDWRAVDWDALAAALAACEGELSRACGPALPTDEAKERLRAWEREGRRRRADEAAEEQERRKLVAKAMEGAPIWAAGAMPPQP